MTRNKMKYDLNLKNEIELDYIFNLLNKLNSIKYNSKTNINEVQFYLLLLLRCMNIPRENIPLLNNRFYEDFNHFKECPTKAEHYKRLQYLYINFYTHLTNDKETANKLKKQLIKLIDKIRVYGYNHTKEGDFQHDDEYIKKYCLIQLYKYTNKTIISYSIINNVLNA